jgi:hypothetical protein
MYINVLKTSSFVYELLLAIMHGPSVDLVSAVVGYIYIYIYSCSPAGCYQLIAIAITLFIVAG